MKETEKNITKEKIGKCLKADKALGCSQGKEIRGADKLGRK